MYSHSGPPQEYPKLHSPVKHIGFTNHNCPVDINKYAAESDLLEVFDVACFDLHAGEPSIAPSSSRLFTLTRSGATLDSEALASALERWREDARDVAFVIGGAHGVDDGVIGASEDTISLSSMTLTHEIARLVLLEQLYRACTILRGEPYHKGGKS